MDKVGAIDIVALWYCDKVITKEEMQALISEQIDGNLETKDDAEKILGKKLWKREL